MEAEIWKDIKWYEWYQISNLWNIKCLNYKKTLKEKLLKCVFNKNWYVYISLYKNSLTKTYRVHRLVAKAFIPNPENKPQVNHIDWNKKNNCVENLEWITASENQKHSYIKLFRKRNINFNWSIYWKKVNQYDLNWNLLKVWSSICKIENELNITKWNISKCCKSKRKTAWWFNWKYV